MDTFLPDKLNCLALNLVVRSHGPLITYEQNNAPTLRFLSIFAIVSLRVVKLGLSSGFSVQQSVMTP